MQNGVYTRGHATLRHARRAAAAAAQYGDNILQHRRSVHCHISATRDHDRDWRAGPRARRDDPGIGYDRRRETFQRASVESRLRA